MSALPLRRPAPASAAGQFVEFRFGDGRVGLVPVETAARRIRQLHKIVGREYGRRGGRPSAKGQDLDLLLRFGELALRIGFRRARMKLTALIAREHRVSMRSARRWVDQVIDDSGKAQPKIKADKTPPRA